MGITSSLNAGVMGLGVNATRLSAISDNIANSATNGYKRAVVDFSSLVNGGNTGFRYDAGGVRATSHRDVAAEGSMVTTNNPTDISITGRGLLPVTTVGERNEATGERPFMVTSTGAFSRDDEGYLRTTSGLQLLGWPITDGDVGTVVRESQSSLVPVQLSDFDFSPNPTTRGEISVNLPSEAADITEPYVMSINYFDALGVEHRLRMEYTPKHDTTANTGDNEWSLRIKDSSLGDISDAANDATTTVGLYDVVFAANSFAAGDPANPVAGTALAAGGIQSITPDAAFAGTYDGATGLATIAGATGAINLQIGAIGTAGNLTQFASDFTPASATQNGSILGVIDRVEITSAGVVEGIYNTGSRRALFQVPVVDMPNPNGLTALNNQAFAISEDSGPFYLWDAGSGPTGTMNGYTIEQSTVDITQELTMLIETQRAYSSNAKIVQTVDEMLQETTNLKR